MTEPKAGDYELDARLQRSGSYARGRTADGLDFEAALSRAQQQPSRRGWLVAGAAAAVVVAVLGASVLLARARPGSHLHPAAGPVPWLAATVPVPALSPAAPPIPPEAVSPACANPADLRLLDLDTASGTSRGAPGLRLRLALRYVGAKACTFGATTASLHLIGTPVQPLGEPGLETNLATVRRGQIVIVGADWLTSCGMQPRPDQVELVLAGRPAPTLRAAVTSAARVPCRPVAAGVRALQPVGTVVAAPGTSATLLARASELTLESGGRLRFTVTLTNPTDQAVRLEPCPSYVVLLARASVRSQADWTAVGHPLNCAAAPATIAAGAAVAFEIRADLPPGVGFATMSWWLIGQSQDDPRSVSLALP